MASARPTARTEEEEVATLLATIIPRRPTERDVLLAERILRRLDGTPLGKAFDQALRDPESYSGEGVAAWITAHGYSLGGQSVRKWRAANGIARS